MSAFYRDRVLVAREPLASLSLWDVLCPAYRAPEHSLTLKRLSYPASISLENEIRKTLFKEILHNKPSRVKIVGL